MAAPSRAATSCAHCGRGWRERRRWSGPPLWLHGDLHPANILVDATGHLRAVLDFGDLTAGDPATDLAVAWLAFEPEARAAFRRAGDRGDGHRRRHLASGAWLGAQLRNGIRRAFRGGFRDAGDRRPHAASGVARGVTSDSATAGSVTRKGQPGSRLRPLPRSNRPFDHREQWVQLRQPKFPPLRRNRGLRASSFASRCVHSYATWPVVTGTCSTGVSGRRILARSKAYPRASASSAIPRRKAAIASNEDGWSRKRSNCGCPRYPLVCPERTA